MPTADTYGILFLPYCMSAANGGAGHSWHGFLALRLTHESAWQPTWLSILHITNLSVCQQMRLIESTSLKMLSRADLRTATAILGIDTGNAVRKDQLCQQVKQHYSVKDVPV